MAMPEREQLSHSHQYQQKQQQQQQQQNASNMFLSPKQFMLAIIFGLINAVMCIPGKSLFALFYYCLSLGYQIS
jgi:uncharacterized membrane protein